MKNILRELLAAEQPITGTYLANVNQVTPRTTRDDIKHLDAILHQHGATIVSVISKGYKLEVNDEKHFRVFLQSLSYKDHTKDDIPTTPEERVSYIIRRLLLNERYIKLDDLADELYVSRSTIQADLKTVKQILHKYCIELEPRPNYGLKATGDEMRFRFCLSEYLFDRDEIKVNSLVKHLYLLFLLKI